MAIDNEKLLQRLLATFRQEADEHLQALSAGLLALEKSPADAQERIETIFREVHSFKGAARAVNLAAIETLCQSLESVFAALKAQRLALTPPLLDQLHRGSDTLYRLVEGPTEQARVPAPTVTVLARQLAAAATAAPEATAAPAAAPAAAPIASPMVAPASAPPPAAPAEPLAAPQPTGAATVRVATTRLDLAMRQTEELLGPCLAAQQRVKELAEARAEVAAWKKRRVALQPSLRQVDKVARRDAGLAACDQELRRLLDHLDEETGFVATLEDRLRRLGAATVRDERGLAIISGGLQEAVKEMQLLPCAALLDLMPRLVRELAQAQGKLVELVMQGGEIEIDRRILDELKDPLIHLLRNAVDHGIEAPAARTAAGKPTQGTLTLAIAQQDGGRIEIRFSDDGAGIDGARVAAAACKLGLISGEEAARLGERESLALALRSGVSTSPIVTDVSGRGLGLAIVREKVERLGGTVAIETQTGGGTAFRLVVPLTLATFRAVLVRVGERLHALPAGGVERVALVAPEQVRTVENRETVTLGGTVLSLARLDAILEQPRGAPAETAAPRIPLIIVRDGDVRLAVQVDEIVGEQEILVKPLGPQLVRVRNVAGATLLGSGRLVPALNIADVVRSAARAAPAVATATPEVREEAQRAILVAEDSITSRALLKGILESAGYAVATAVDGAEAFATLKSGTFDLLVSDVEMPRLDGFDLTARVRADKKLADLPVVLVTALESREHRARGIDVGANAYIVKSSFDQSNLLDVVRRLL